MQVYQLIVARPGIKKVEIADAVDKSYASVKRYVKVLTDGGLVEYRDSKKTGVVSGDRFMTRVGACRQGRLA